MKNNINRIICIFTILALPMVLIGQTEEVASNLNFWEKMFGNLVLFGGAIVIAAAIFALVQLFSIILKMEELRMLKEKGVEEVVEAYRQPQESWWSKFIKSATKSVPVAQESEIIMAHNYDGIRELDNRLPPWWLWMFYVSIIFSVFYWFAFHVTGTAPSIHEEYAIEMEEAEKAVAAYVALKADKVDENSVTMVSDPDELALGESIYQTSCATCHGSLGEGLAGPNLTDEFWLHGGSINDVFKTIKYGVAGKAMVPWKDLMRASDMQRVASYIMTLKGTDPPNQKEPEGEIWKPTEEEGGEPEGTEESDSGEELSINTN